jgi:hypothetical protein
MPKFGFHFAPKMWMFGVGFEFGWPIGHWAIAIGAGPIHIECQFWCTKNGTRTGSTDPKRH